MLKNLSFNGLRQKNFLRRGFTLVELLVAIAIIAILGAITLPAISSLTSAGRVNETVTGISLSLNQARSYAMAHNTHVWVGFLPKPSTSSSPAVLLIGMVAGTTGGSGDINSPATYAPISKVQSYPNFIVADVDATKQANSSSTWASALPAGTDLTSTSSSPFPSFTETVNGTATSFNGPIVQFDPEGEASMSTLTVLPRWIQFGLESAAGGSKADVAIIQVAGLSGQVQVFRP